MWLQRAWLSRFGLSCLAFFAGTLHGLAQSSVITTYVGHSLPRSGSPALTQSIDFPSGIADERICGF